MNGFADLALTALFESNTNPRKTFAETALAELAASVREKGVLVPLLVRPASGLYEIIAGARRYRAACAAAIDTVPCRIVDLDDKQVIEVQVIENLQRADVHPVEEAEAYGQLINLHGYDTFSIAAKVGKSERYVAGRLALLRLELEVSEAYQRDEIQAGHAALISRLAPADQRLALKHAKSKSEWNGSKPTVNNLKHWIEDELQMELKRAPFPLKDANLGAGTSCASCPKNTACNPTLFGEEWTEARCTDRICYDHKLDNWVNRKINEGLVQLSSNYGEKCPEGVLGYGQWNQYADKAELKEKGVIVIGRDKGQVVKFARVKAGRSGASSREAEQRRNHRIQKEAHGRIIAAVLDAFDGQPVNKRALSLDTLRDVAVSLFQERGHIGRKVAKQQLGWDDNYEPGYTKSKVAEFAEHGVHAFLLHVLLMPFYEVSSYGSFNLPDLLVRVSSRYGVDAKSIEDEVREEVESKRKPAAAAAKKKSAMKGRK